ncbi:MAG: hypothetical protein II276_01470 [Bacteroidales bacterium]|nr:hypothetical protein [Bacteroidales bacterium]
MIKKIEHSSLNYGTPTCTQLDMLSQDVLCGSWNDEEEGGEDFDKEIDDSENWS